MAGVPVIFSVRRRRRSPQSPKKAGDRDILKAKHFTQRSTHLVASDLAIFGGVPS